MKPSYVFRIAHELGQRKRGLKQSSMLVEKCYAINILRTIQILFRFKLPRV